MGHTSKSIWLLILISSLVALASYRFVFLGLELAFPDFESHLSTRWWAVATHVGVAPVALLVGALQFIKSIRANWPVFHRWLGRIYVVAVIIGGIGGLSLAFNAMGGPIAGLGFGLLAVCWLWFTLQGWRTARARRFAEHRQWMIRSFALTFGAVTLRLYLPVFFAAGYDYSAASVYLAWISWVPNLIIAQWWLARAKPLSPR